MPITASTLIEVKRIKGKGRGLFAREFIPEDTLIERVPVIVLPQADLYREDGTSAIWEYAFEWNTGEVAVALGFGSMYNHSYTPNAHYQDAGPRQKNSSPGEISKKAKRSPSTITAIQTTKRKCGST